MKGKQAYNPGFILPSISPINGNNPGFRILDFQLDSNNKWVLADYEQYYLDFYSASLNYSSNTSVNYQFHYNFSSFYKPYLQN